MDPAFIRSRRLIGARRLLTGYFFLPDILSSWFIITQLQRTIKVGPDWTIFQLILSDKLSLGLLSSYIP